MAAQAVPAVQIGSGRRMSRVPTGLTSMPADAWESPSLPAIKPIREEAGTKTICKAMAKRLRGNEVSHPKHQGFWPDKLFYHLFSDDDVSQVVGELVNRKALSREGHGTSNDAKSYWTGVVCGTSLNAPGREFRRILALLLLVAKEDCLEQFIAEDLGDTKLPLDLSAMRAAQAFDDWEPHEMDVIHDSYQWKLTVPCFVSSKSSGSGTVCHVELKNNAIPPWYEIPSKPGADEDQTRDGGYGDVQEIKIHPWHHDFNPIFRSLSTDPDIFALKTLKRADRKTFDREVDMLEKFGKCTHTVRLLAKIIREDRNALGGEKYSLLFPWAELDLSRYWKIKERDRTRILWSSEQWHGLAEALAYIHNPGDLRNEENNPLYGRHGDIKPENILWFRNGKGGMLVFSDMGLTEVHKDSSRSNIPGHTIPATPTYRPPECDMQGKKGHISRSFDIWTLGCVFLAHVVWMLKGTAGLDDFRKQRYSNYITNVETEIFFDLVRVPGTDKYAFKVKDSVTKCFNNLHEHEECTQYIHDFLDLIQKKMLIVQSDTPEIRRIKANSLEKEMLRLSVCCKNDEAYCTKPCPRKTTCTPYDPVEAKLSDVALNSIDVNEMADQLELYPGNTRSARPRGT